MSTSPEADVRVSLTKANEAMVFMNEGLRAFQAHVNRFDFDSAEGERVKIHAALDDYLDHFGAAQKRLERER
jgi:hypothetical protein